MSKNFFKVGGVQYEIIFDENLFDRAEVLGLTDYNNAKILVDANLSIDRKEQVLIHELTHAVLFESGYDQNPEEPFWEDFVHRTSLVWYQVIKENFYQEQNKDLKEILKKLKGDDTK